MEKKTYNEGLAYLTEKYDIDFDSIISDIKKKGYDKVAIQVPDGFKLHVLDIADALSEGAGVDVYIWGGSTYGACDVPTGLEKLGIKSIIQFGHARFRADETKKPDMIKNE